MPAYIFQDVNGKEIYSQSIILDKAAMIMNFEPYCETNLQQVKMIAKEVNTKQQINKLWNANMLSAALNHVVAKYFQSAANIVVEVDTHFQFDSWVGYLRCKSIYCFNINYFRTSTFTY